MKIHTKRCNKVNSARAPGTGCDVVNAKALVLYCETPPLSIIHYSPITECAFITVSYFPLHFSSFCYYDFAHTFVCTVRQGEHLVEAYFSTHLMATSAIKHAQITASIHVSTHIFKVKALMHSLGQLESSSCGDGRNACSSRLPEAWFPSKPKFIYFFTQLPWFFCSRFSLPNLASVPSIFFPKFIL